MSGSVLIKNGVVVTVDNANRTLNADIMISGGRIEHIIERSGLPPNNADQSSDAEVIDAAGCVILPGFIQTHVHLCQTLMRGQADDMKLIDWLRNRVWPMEAAHSEDSVYASARLGIAEMILGGTTTALTMETVRHTDAVFRAVEESGFRATVGKCMMDRGYGVPANLIEDTDQSITESLSLLERWHGRYDGRIQYGLAPRFALSCTRRLLEQIGKLANEHGVVIHTHASESREEIELICAETGFDNITYLDVVGLTGPRSVFAHCVWATDAEIERLAATGTSVAHCPSSNLKLGSGIARIEEMLDRGVRVSLGADGAPCNNRLDMFTEMRTAALLQKSRRGPSALPAQSVLRLATIDGARALRLDDEIGSIEEGKRADLAIIDFSRVHLVPHPDVISTIVYAAEHSDVRTVLIDGRIVMRDRTLLTVHEDEVKASALREARALASRALIV